MAAPDSGSGGSPGVGLASMYSAGGAADVGGGGGRGRGGGGSGGGGGSVTEGRLAGSGGRLCGARCLRGNWLTFTNERHTPIMAGTSA